MTKRKGLTLTNNILSLSNNQKNKSFKLKIEYNKKHKVIKWPYKSYVTPIKHACKALMYLNEKENSVIGYKKQHKYEEMIKSTIKIICRFVYYKPELWKLIDARYNLMKYLVNSIADSLIYFILFEKKGKNNKSTHVPRIKCWKKKINTENNYNDNEKHQKHECDLIKDNNVLRIAISLTSGIYYHCYYLLMISYYC